MSLQDLKQSSFYDLRPMQIDDIEAGMRLKALNNWNQTREGWDLLLSYPNSYNWVAESDGNVVGTVSMAIYPPASGWIGMMLVHPDYQGRGIGRKLMQKVLSRTDKVANFYLDATPIGKLLYDKLDFITVGKVNRMVNMSVSAPSQMTEIPGEIIPITHEYLNQVIDYDLKVTGMNRSFLINYLFKQRAKHALAFVSNGEVKGFCMARPGSLYFQIGPVSADDNNIATALLTRAFQLLANQPVVIDITDQSKSLAPILKKCGFEVQRSFTRMYRGDQLHQSSSRNIYISAGPEVG